MKFTNSRYDFYSRYRSLFRHINEGIHVIFTFQNTFNNPSCGVPQDVCASLGTYYAPNCEGIGKLKDKIQNYKGSASEYRKD